MLPIIFLLWIHLYSRYAYAPPGGRSGIVCAPQPLILACNDTEVVVAKVNVGGPIAALGLKEPCHYNNQTDCLGFHATTVSQTAVRLCVWKKSICTFPGPPLKQLFLCSAALHQIHYTKYSQFQCLNRNITYDICEDGDIWSSSGYVHSTYFPYHYPQGTCRRTVTLPVGYRMQIKSVHVDIGSCTTDYLRFLNSTGSELLKICGKGHFNLTVTENVLVVEFVVGQPNNRYEGFNFHFQGVYIGSPTQSVQISTSEGCLTNTPKVTSMPPVDWRIIVGALAASVAVLLVLVFILVIKTCILNRRASFSPPCVDPKHSFTEDDQSICSKSSTSINSSKELIKC